MKIDVFSSLGLPDVPGVYRFLDTKGGILYVGKATSLRDRVRSYFNDDIIDTRGRRIVEMVAQAHTVTFDVTPSVLEALILEADQIKHFNPPYNVAQKDNKSYTYVILTREDFPKLITIRERTLLATLDSKKVLHQFGPFPSGTALREGLRIIRRMFPYRDEKCSPYQDQLAAFCAKKGVTPAEAIAGGFRSKPCFNRHLGLCPGVCTGEITKEEYRAVNIRNIQLFFSNQKKRLQQELEREMMQAAKEMRFEDAGSIKHTLFALDHINDIALIKDDKREERLPDVYRWDIERAPVPGDHSDGARTLAQDYDMRLECYDIAHLSGTDHVGVMVVSHDHEIQKGEYRKFKIKTLKGANDVAALAEVISRRLTHDEWPWPDIVIVDGGQLQLDAARKAVDGFYEKYAEDERVQALVRPLLVSVVKDRRHKAKGVIVDEGQAAREGSVDEVIEHYKPIIIQLDAEAHRFAISYHRNLRSKRYRPQ